MDEDRVELENSELLLEMATINICSWETNMTFNEARELLLKDGWGKLSTERQLEILNEVNKEANH